MIGIRLITSGLKEHIHAVIGYEIHSKTIERVLLQPKDGAKFDFDAMYEINKLKISSLHEQGLDRAEAIKNLATLLHTEESILVWYKPFIVGFLDSENISYDKDKIIDLRSIAQIKKGFTPMDYTFSSVCDALNVKQNLVEVSNKLDQFESIKAVRRF